MKRRGFTLIELLVVISIVALLISILLPSLQKARNSSKAIKCASNLKQFGLATHMYLQDHKEWFFVHEQVTPGPVIIHWYDGDGPLLKYLPVANSTFKSSDTVGDCPINQTGYLRALNWFLDYGYNKHTTGRRLQTYRNHSGSLLFVDNANSAIVASAPSYAGINNPGIWYNPEGVQFIHDQAAHVTHMDGHVSRYKFETMTNAMYLP